MLNVTHTMERMEIPLTSTTRAILAAKEIIGETDTCRTAAKLIKSILSLDVSFTDPFVARVTTLAVMEQLVKVKGEVGDETALYAAAVERAREHMEAPRNAWMYAKSEEGSGAPLDTKEIEGTTVSVEIKADGRIKRGGKQVVADVLFKKHVLESETPCDNSCFVKILMKEAGMSLAGARTYAHSLRAKNGMVQSRVQK